MSYQPTVRAVRRSGAQAELDLFIPGTLDFFPDHFPRLSILPGVVQIDWAVMLARAHLDLRGNFRGMRNIKFVNPVMPDTALVLTLDHSTPGELSFSYRAGARVFSSGRMLFAPDTVSAA